MRWYFQALAIVVLGVSIVAADEKADAVIKKAIDAHGGADALNKYKAGRFNLKGEMSVMGLDLNFKGKLTYMVPDRYRMEMEAEIMGMKMLISQAVKGDVVKGKVTVGGMTIPIPDSDKDELRLASAMQEAEQLTPLLDSKKFEVKLGSEEDVNGSKADALLIKIKALDKDVKFCIDKKSGLLVKTSHKAKSPGEDGKEVLEESIHLEYKKVKGVQVATKLTVMHDGKKFMTGEVSDIELIEKLDDKEFTVDD